jgi:hypothetical protein
MLGFEGRFLWEAFLHILFFWLNLPLLEEDFLSELQSNPALLGSLVWIVLLMVLYVSLRVELRKQGHSGKSH